MKTNECIELYQSIINPYNTYWILSELEGETITSPLFISKVGNIYIDGLLTGYNCDDVTDIKIQLTNWRNKDILTASFLLKNGFLALSLEDSEIVILKDCEEYLDDKTQCMRRFDAINKHFCSPVCIHSAFKADECICHVFRCGMGREMLDMDTPLKNEVDCLFYQ